MSGRSDGWKASESARNRVSYYVAHTATARDCVVRELADVCICIGPFFQRDLVIAPLMAHNALYSVKGSRSINTRHPFDRRVPPNSE